MTMKKKKKNKKELLKRAPEHYIKHVICRNTIKSNSARPQVDYSLEMSRPKQATLSQSKQTKIWFLTERHIYM